MSGNQTVVTDLQEGQAIGFDVVALTRNQDTAGMLSENDLTGKSNNAGQFAQYTLVQDSHSTVSTPNKADLLLDNRVGLADFLIFAEQWLVDDNTYYSLSTLVIGGNGEIIPDGGIYLDLKQAYPE